MEQIRQFLGVLALSAVGLGLFSTDPVEASVDNFEFDLFDASYELEILDDGRSVLFVTETLVAAFPDYDQNRGIARIIPDRYLGRPLNTVVDSVVDETGNPRSWSVEKDGSTIVVESVVSAGQFVYGRHTYVISYRQTDVVRDFADSTGIQEFYWDINGVGWPQRFGQVNARITIPTHLAQQVPPGLESCYQGAAGSTDRCSITRETMPDGSLVFVASAGPLSPRQTMTVAIGFEPGTFQAPIAGQTPVMVLIVQGGGLLSGVAALVWAWRLRLGVLRDAPGRPVVIPEYLPPAGIAVSRAALLRHEAAKIPLAGLLELAVSGKLKLSEGKGFGSNWSVIPGGKEFTPGDEEFLQVLLGGTPGPGEVTKLPKNSTAVSRRLESYVSAERAAMKEDSLYQTVPFVASLGPIGLGALAVFGGFSGFSLYDGEGATATMWALVVGMGGAVAGAVALIAKTPLGAPGSELRDYLKGLKMYIRLAEKDRLHYLQSPQGALRESISVDNPREVVKLYERLLPWAVIVGEEKRWVRELDRLYRDQQPGWINGRNPRGLASLSSFQKATRGSFRSSSSGGTGGGGSAGGGGGGGGGGGR